MTYDEDLADRIRQALAGEDDVREVKMFGGLTFMVNSKMTATANTHGELMVRCDADGPMSCSSETVPTGPRCGAGR